MKCYNGRPHLKTTVTVLNDHIPKELDTVKCVTCLGVYLLYINRLLVGVGWCSPQMRIGSSSKTGKINILKINCKLSGMDTSQTGCTPHGQEETGAPNILTPKGDPLLISWPQVILVNPCCCSVAQLCSTLHDLMTPLSVGIPQARIQEWLAISFSRASLQIKNQTHISCIVRHFLYHWATLNWP